VSAFIGRPSTQRGAALILMMTIIVLGIAWYTVGALSKAARSTADKEIRTGAALYAAKRALLDYVAAQAAQPDNAIPGRLPCPEPLAPAAGNEGIAAGCSDNTATYVGRLPWRTLGVDQIRDGDGELLWYILGRGFRQSAINFGSQDEIELDGVSRQAVAMIIAPGAVLNTLSEAGAPPANCPRVNQQPRSVAAPFDPARFLECGRNSTPAPGNEPQYKTDKTSPWTNDRMVTITASELMDAISGPVADRLQRQVAPMLANWDAAELAARGKSWGAAPPNGHNLPYLPYASTWGDPTTNNYCGNQGIYEGLIPAEPTCYNSNWTGNASVSGGLALSFCGNVSGSPAYRRCVFERMGFSTPLSATITFVAADVARAYRSTITASDLTVTGGGSATMAMSLSGGTSEATLTIDVSWPPTLAFWWPVEVRVPQLQDAAVLSDSRLTWFWNNQWQRYTYYHAAPSATAASVMPCVNPGDAGCISVTGLPAGSGNTWDKRLVLVLSGKPLATQTQPSSGRSNYFEGENLTSGDRQYEERTPLSTTFNDRVAACPFQYPTQSGPALTICN